MRKSSHIYIYTQQKIFVAAKAAAGLNIRHAIHYLLFFEKHSKKEYRLFHPIYRRKRSRMKITD